MAKTVDEIAKATGVSVTTVRFVIAGQAERYRISEQTRQRVERFIAEHGYSINHAARALKLRRSESVGFVVPDLANPFFARIMSRLEALCRAQEHILLAVASHEDPGLEERAVASLLGRGVDGLVLAPCQPDVPAALCAARRRPGVVMFDRDYGHADFPTVLSDNEQGGFELTRHVLGETDGACVFLIGHPASPTIEARLRSYVEACSAAGRVSLVRQHAEDSPQAGRQLMTDFLNETGGPPSAFLCSSLLVLEGALQALKALPGGIDPAIVIGTFDDHTMLDLLANRVFSVRQDEDALAERVFARLGLAGESVPAQREIIACRVVGRNVPTLSGPG